SSNRGSTISTILNAASSARRDANGAPQHCLKNATRIIRNKRFSIKIPFTHRHPLPRSHPVLPVKLIKRIQHASHHIDPRVIDKRLKSVPRGLVKRVSTELIDET